MNVTGAFGAPVANGNGTWTVSGAIGDVPAVTIAANNTVIVRIVCTVDKTFVTATGSVDANGNGRVDRGDSMGNVASFTWNRKNDDGSTSVTRQTNGGTPISFTIVEPTLGTLRKSFNGRAIIAAPDFTSNDLYDSDGVTLRNARGRATYYYYTAGNIPLNVVSVTDIGPATTETWFWRCTGLFTITTQYDAVRGDFDARIAGGATERASFTVKIFAPTSTPTGYVDVSIITASARDFALSQTPSVIDTTQAVAGDLLLTKSSVPAPGVPVKPGNAIVYTTTFFNKGATALNTVVLYDEISPYTSYVLQTGAASLPSGLTGAAFQVSRDGGISWTNDNVGAGADPTVTNVRAVLSGVLNAGLSGSISFTVSVK